MISVNSEVDTELRGVDQRQSLSFSSRLGSDLARVLRSNDNETAVRLARSMACLEPNDPGLAIVSKAIWKTGDLSISASFARMAQCLDPVDDSQKNDRFHRSVKAGRPSLMPPHWMRDVLFEAETLQTFIEKEQLSAARSFLRRSDLAGHRYYVPRFRALQHFINFNTDSNYRSAFMRNCLVISMIKSTNSSVNDSNYHQGILDGILDIAKWTEERDTVISTGGLEAYPNNVEKRIRSGRISGADFTDELNVWKDVVLQSFSYCWNSILKNEMVEALFGISGRHFDDAISRTHFHVNEIVAGPVLGPHYHSAHRHDELRFPFLSAVYYPRSVPKNDISKAGYLEFGRPEFVIPFEPSCANFRPVTGSLIVFPAFAYHGVVPIDTAPRYSINIDFYLKPKDAPTWMVSEFFD